MAEIPKLGDDMFAALAQGASHPAVAAWLALGTAGVAAAVVAMAWSVNARQIRLAEQLARRQFLITSGATAARDVDQGGAAEIEGAARGEGRAARPSRCRRRSSRDPTR